MLIATPYRDFDVSDRSPPRVISEVRKSCGSYYFSPTNFRIRITGDLLLQFGNDQNWWPRRVSVRCGQLLVSSSYGSGNGAPTSLRLPLRHLSLQAGPLPNSFSLCKGQNKVLTLQTSDENTFGEWVKTVAIELIRQTPLDAIKYLDILTIADCWKRREPNYEKDWNYNYVKIDNKLLDTSCKSCEQNQIFSPQKTINIPSEIEEKYVEDLIKKCQDSQNYVPVKEKLFLFESLCKLRRKVRSTEDVSLKIDPGTKRARSLHDLSSLNSFSAVREICKYFENKNNDHQNVSFGTKRLVNSDSQLNDLYRVRKVFAV